MARAARLLELLIRLRASPRVTAQELAERFEVSRRTMLRDLRALADLGVPLVAVPGPGGGYMLARDQRLAPLALTVDEALGVLLSYEAFLRYAQSPFAAENLSAVTKLRASLPPDVARDLERIRDHVAIIARPRGEPAPLLGDLLQASLDGAHLRIVYDSRSGVSERVIFPFGLFAADGRWYCACHDDKRGRNISLRADRVVSIVRVEGRDRPPHVPPVEWLDVVERDDGQGLPLLVTLTARGVKNSDPHAQFGQLRADERGGGTIEGRIPQSEIDWYATQLLALGADAIVESPPELIAAIDQHIRAIAALYRRRPSPSAQQPA